MARLRRPARLVRLDFVARLGEDLAALPGAHPLPPGGAEPGGVIAAARAAGRAAAPAGLIASSQISSPTPVAPSAPPSALAMPDSSHMWPLKKLSAMSK